MNAVEIINKKKYGKELSFEEIEYMVKGYTNDKIPDYQMSAFLMAVYFKDLSTIETSYLTEVMVESGDQIDLSFLDSLVVDKHSTGGVGDKVSLVIAPIVASLGIPFAKMSGRGLGHTGGTIDKLESISGFNTELSLELFREQVKQHNIALVGQTGNLVPADKKIYALRDVTGTVDSIPLIASSIMSKKIASGANSILLDIKVGSGAFMKTVEDAELLANTMVGIGDKLGRNTVAILTSMFQPLGNEIGNSNEVMEVIKILKNEEYSQDLFDVSVEVASQMVLLAEKSRDISEAKEMVLNAISGGTAYDKFVEFINLQGGDLNSIKYNQAKYNIDVKSNAGGYIESVNTTEVGQAAMLLGAGREKKGDLLDHQAGITFNVKLGDKINDGDLLCTIHTNKNNYEEIIKKLKDAITFSENPVSIPDSVLKIIN